MTVTFDRNGDLVLNGKTALKPGAQYVVTRVKGRTVLRRKRAASSRKSYLTPPPLPRGVLAKVYSTPDPEWDTVEAAAVARSRSLLAGTTLDEL